MKILRTVLVALLFIICSHPTFANTLYLGERVNNTTTDVMKQRKAIVTNIKLVFEQPDLKKCKKVGLVRTSIPIEIWQKGDACTIRQNELRRQSVLLKGNTVYIDVIDDCNAPTYQGQAFCCDGICEIGVSR